MESPILSTSHSLPFDNMLLTFDGEMAIYEREEDDLQALEAIARSIKFYLYTRLHDKSESKLDPCLLHQFELSGICDLYFPPELAGTYNEKKESFKQDLESFMFDLWRDQVTE